MDNMEDSKSITAFLEQDIIDNGSNDPENALNLPHLLHTTTPDTTGVADRCFSFTQLYRHPIHHKTNQDMPARETLLLAYQSIGVVYGDLGTSPTQVLSSISITDLTEDDLLGILSLIIWCLTLFALIKYVFIVLHADDHGEGGTFALYSKLSQHLNLQNKLGLQSSRPQSDTNITSTQASSAFRLRTRKFLERSSFARSLLSFFVLLATCMVIGDGALTPATCVLSALQGIQSRSSKITQDHIVFMAVVLFILLFTFQRCGTSKVSFSFSPIMVLWYVTNVAIGIYNIFTYHPSILKAFSPHYMIIFFLKNTRVAWHVLGAVYLCITGAEALFADLGHFNKRAIQLAFSFVVYPSMILTYAGEAAYLVQHSDQISNAYYSSIPESVYWPMFILSTIAALVASQSMITATFSIVKQSQALDCFPRVQIIHTSSKHAGQIYCPEINYTLMILCVGLVIGFKGGVELANAYGAVVIWVMIITTCLTTLVMLLIWETNIILVICFFLFYIAMEVLFLSSLLNKIPQGGWVPFAISGFFLTVMMSWRYGRNKKSTYETERKMSLGELDQILSSGAIYRTPGVCFFCTDLVNGIPPIIRQYINHTNSAHEIMVILTVRTTRTKYIPPEERLNVGKLGSDGVYRCLVQYGYKETMSTEADDFVDSIMEKIRELVDNKQKLESAAEKGFVFVIGRTILKPIPKNRWFARFTINYLYRFLQKNCISEVSALKIPQGKTLQVGMVYEI